jgi:hypothetical protein
LRSAERYTVKEAVGAITSVLRENAGGVFNWERLSDRGDPDISVETTDARTERRIKI